ncbi:MAG TPA: sigma-70 family RNA polymerase sigma factor [Candidatus Kapabacteria bacterium]|nr:sigma-70 family RNA polymerase sigma factor [Candidatus Kapabacteria bacterium]
MIEITMDMNTEYNYLGAAFKKAVAFFTREERVSDVTFLQLLNPVKENLYNFIYKALSYSEDANDVYQETVLRAFKYRSRFDPNASFKTWIFTIANNEIKGHFNKNKKSPGSYCLELEDHPDITCDCEDEKLVYDIYEVAQQLTPQQQRVFFLFYDYRFSLKEINIITGLKEGNIKFILNQAREKIKEKLFLRSIK